MFCLRYSLIVTSAVALAACGGDGVDSVSYSPPTFTFRDAVYSAGNYTGRFNTSVSGINTFNGQLTGPNGEELIGGWALPFHYSGDNKDHQAIGAWVAKH